MSETWRPRPSRGVMGYVAELQQLDSDAAPSAAAPWAPADSVRPVPAASPWPESDPFAHASLFSDEPAPIVSHVRPGVPGRRMRMAVISGGVLAILAGLGVGYAALGGSGPDTVAAPRVTATTVPADGVLNLEPALPGVDPVTGATISPAPTVDPTTTAAARTTTPAARVPRRTTRPAAPGVPDLPAGTVTPPAPADPAPTLPAAPSLPQRPLPAEATFTYTAEEGESGWTGYSGQVRVRNPGDSANAGWRVTLTVPGGNRVDASGASASQEGETVTFTGDPIAGGGSLSFTFTVDGTLTGLPGGCRIDGNACS
ncbi:cellulose binding domain-containing protein [Couchioplanes caeruleus]|uniref:cellulose binding domain-containing protein n=1 Tax=Couchioplanes caeruleus TaxID=56438 RepID=UPI00201C8B38|nr:cellulose binding domain-containing protein [Couchioplanes caeruleus]UQU67089.1 cellulose binding domain-containing protein [Couchioplanes caeruleus]